MPSSDKISLLDDAFAEYIKDQNTTSFTSKVSSILTAFSGKDFKISIIDSGSRNREPFFGMRIFPDKKYADDLLRDLVSAPEGVVTLSDMCNRWKRIRRWEIEIDSQVFDRTIINFNPQELTAMLLHEIGHTIYSDKKIEMFYRVYKECGLQLSLAEKASAKFLYSLYLIPLTLVCGFRNWGVTSTDLREEIFADKSVQKLGYSEHLISAYSKIIKVSGTGGFEFKDQDETQLMNSMTFCNVNIKDLRHRREKLKDELYSTGVTHNSQYIRNVVSYIMGKVAIAKKNRYNGSVVLEAAIQTDFDDTEFLNQNHLVFDTLEFGRLEVQMNMTKRNQEFQLANEALGFRKRRNPEIPSQLDVDLLFVEVDRITNHADRRYVLDLIYHQEEKILHFLEICEYDDSLKKAYYGRMQDMLRQIADLRKAVLAKRNFDKDYKVFVKYPPGYEG